MTTEPVGDAEPEGPGDDEPKGVESEVEPVEEPEPEPQIQVSALDVTATSSMAAALEAFKFFNHTIGRQAMGAVVREVTVEIHGQPWCRLVVGPNGVPHVEPLVSVVATPEETP